MTAPSRGDLVNAALEWVRSHGAPGAGGVELRPTTDLLSTGVLDSFAFAELIVFLEDRGGRPIDLEHMEPDEFCTVAGLCAASGGADGASGGGRGGE